MHQKRFHRRLLVMLCLSAGAGFLPALPSIGAEILTDAAPPSDRAESPPPPRAGYAWAPGHWEWSGRFYTWVSGTWIVEHRGHWIPDRWEQSDTHWHFVRGHWEH
jgi:WXXGXW repeat (2 copies)